MRICITRPLYDRIDGIRLSQFYPGRIYDVSASLGCYLVTIGGAVPAEGSFPGVVLPLTRPGIDHLREPLLRVPKKHRPYVSLRERSEAADRVPSAPPKQSSKVASLKRKTRAKKR